jgi:hypothetical protein
MHALTPSMLTPPIADPTGSAADSSLIPTSPRSVQSCLVLGIDPTDLAFRPANFYRRFGEDMDVSQLRFERNERVRQERLCALIDTRKRLIDDNWSPPEEAEKQAKRNGEERKDSSMIEEEKKRLEVSKRRQEREIAQMMEHEVKRAGLLAKQQRKVDELERRARELERVKKENDVAWIEKQRELEIQKMREEQALEEEAMRLAGERFHHERELQVRQEREDRIRKKKATEM